MVVSLLDGSKCMNNTDVMLVQENNQPHQQWKFVSGAIQNVGCNKMVLDVGPTTTEKERKIQIYEKSDSTSQKWSSKSIDAVLTHASFKKDSQKKSNQTWSTVYTEVGYDLGLVPGFPGALDREVSKRAMQICDKSMSFLLGSQISVGTLKSIADSVDTHGPNRMPGFCCLDVATNSEFFGYDVRRYCVLSCVLFMG
jgi:hypothetical protein